MAFGDRLTLEQLHTMRDKAANVCVDVLSLPLEEQDRNGAKGAASPVQGSQVSAWFCVLLDEAIKRREAVELLGKYIL